MTALTQSELDDMRRRAESRHTFRWWDDILALLDHIAQLTAERDEAHEKLRFSESKREEDYKKYVLDMADAADRIAGLEAQPSARPSVDDVDRVARALCESDGCCWDNIADTNAIAMSQHWERSLTSKEDYRHDARTAIAAMSQPSAQFVAGMRRAAEMVRGVPFIDKHYRTWPAIWPDEGENTGNLSWQDKITTHSDLIADAILAEAALKGEGE